MPNELQGAFLKKRPVERSRTVSPVQQKLVQQHRRLVSD
jgi:hypothetical protein